MIRLCAVPWALERESQRPTVKDDWSVQGPRLSPLSAFRQISDKRPLPSTVDRALARAGLDACVLEKQERAKKRCKSRQRLKSHPI